MFSMCTDVPVIRGAVLLFVLLLFELHAHHEVAANIHHLVGTTHSRMF